MISRKEELRLYFEGTHFNDRLVLIGARERTEVDPIVTKGLSLVYIGHSSGFESARNQIVWHTR